MTFLRTRLLASVCHPALDAAQVDIEAAIDRLWWSLHGLRGLETQVSF